MIACLGCKSTIQLLPGIKNIPDHPWFVFIKTGNK